MAIEIDIDEFSDSDISRFWEKVDTSEDSECWEWQAGSSGTGYGFFYANGDHLRAHRVAFTLKYHDPGELQVNHHCDNRLCVNPNHLYSGDQSDNMKDAVRRGRKPLSGAINIDKSGETNGRAKLTEEQVMRIYRNPEDKTNKELAEEFDVSTGSISHIRNGETWSSVTGHD